MRDQIHIFAGSSNPLLAERVSGYLNMPLGANKIRRFADGELFINIEESVRGHHVYILQSTSSPVNENLMEVLIMIDALKRASAAEITVVLPYYGYARQDRKSGPREPITAKLVADMLEAAGATRLISMDLHAAQIQGFFNIPVDNLFATPIFLEDIQKKFDSEKIIMVSPDAGGV
ncbi:MAG: ribose-phosphate diphosphokinase, partial [Deltaproteobacteria bacterium]|nr:ribose-phosphate diphosphokinase [Deltaproteobacteria bacterium]